MFHYREKFDMGVAHLLHIIRQLHGNLTVIVKLGTGNLRSVLIHQNILPNPGAKMHLIDC